MNEENKNLESFLKKSYEGFDQEPSDMVWKGLEERMDEDKKERPFLWWLWLRNAFVLFAVLGVGFLAYYFISTKSNKTAASSEQKTIETKTSTKFDEKNNEENETQLAINGTKESTRESIEEKIAQKETKNVQRIPSKTEDPHDNDKLSSARTRISSQKKTSQKSKASKQSKSLLESKEYTSEVSSARPTVQNKTFTVTRPIIEKSIGPAPVNFPDKNVSTKSTNIISGRPIAPIEIDKEESQILLPLSILGIASAKETETKEANETGETEIPEETIEDSEELQLEGKAEPEDSDSHRKNERNIVLKLELDKKKPENTTKEEEDSMVDEEDEIKIILHSKNPEDSISSTDAKIEKLNRFRYKFGPSLRIASTIVDIDNQVEAGVSIGLHQEFIKNRWSLVNKTHLNAHGYALDKGVDEDGLSNETLTRYPHFFTEDNQVNSVAATSFFFDNSLGMGYMFIKRKRVNVSFTPSIVWQLYLPQTFHYDLENEEELSLRSNVYLLSLGSVQGSIDFKYIFKNSHHLHTSFLVEKSLIPLGLDNRNTFLGGLQVSYLFGKREK